MFGWLGALGNQISGLASILLEDEESSGGYQNVPFIAKVFEYFVYIPIVLTFISAVLREDKCYCEELFGPCHCLDPQLVKGLSKQEALVLEAKGLAMEYAPRGGVRRQCYTLLLSIAKRSIPK